MNETKKYQNLHGKINHQTERSLLKPFSETSHLLSQGLTYQIHSSHDEKFYEFTRPSKQTTYVKQKFRCSFVGFFP